MENFSKSNSKNYERREILSLLLKRVDALKNNYRQNIAIIGHKSLGKTSLIFDLLHRCKTSEVIPIYINIKSSSLEHFAKNFIGILLYQYLSMEQDPEIKDDFEFLISKSRQRIPNTAGCIININNMIKEKSAPDEIYSILLELPHLLYEETKKPILLILDEFHNLENFDLNTVFVELSNKIMVQKHTMYILISSAIYAAQNILSKKLSLLFGNFEVINLQPFDNKAANAFIEKELRDLNMTETLKHFLIFFTGGYPFYLDVITEQIKCTCLDNKTNSVTEKVILLSLKEAMNKEHGVLNQYFNSKYSWLLNANQNNMYTSILMAIAKGFKKPSQISKFLNKKTHEVNRYLNKLLQNDVIRKKGVFNDINDPLFIYWLKFVLSRRQNSFNMDVHDTACEFETQIKTLLNNFAQESKKKISLRIKELFNLFENDIIELDRKRFMLTHFDEIDITDINGISLLSARRMKKTWICCIEKEFIDETRINDFLIKSKRKDCMRKILIALDGIDVNARLKALEEKVWIWDQNTLNELLGLFEKPAFIK